MAIAQKVNHCCHATTIHNHLGQLEKTHTHTHITLCPAVHICAYECVRSTSGVCFTTSLIRVVTFFLTYSSGSLRQASAAGKTSASITISARLTECLLT